MVTQTARFDKLIDLIDGLPLEERQNLLNVVSKRIAEEQRLRIAASARAAKSENRRGRAKPTSAAKLMREIVG